MAGDVVVVAKLNDVAVGDVLAKRGRRPGHARQGAPDAGAVGRGHRRPHEDDEKISTSLHRLAEEDPSLRVRYDPVSRRLVVDAMGDTHLQVTLERLRRRFNVEVTTAPPPVPATSRRSSRRATSRGG